MARGGWGGAGGSKRQLNLTQIVYWFIYEADPTRMWCSVIFLGVWGLLCLGDQCFFSVHSISVLAHLPAANLSLPWDWVWGWLCHKYKCFLCTLCQCVCLTASHPSLPRDRVWGWLCCKCKCFLCTLHWSTYIFTNLHLPFLSLGAGFEVGCAAAVSAFFAQVQQQLHNVQWPRLLCCLAGWIHNWITDEVSK